MESIGKTIYPFYAHFLSLTLRRTQKPFGVMTYICDHSSNCLHLLSIVLEIVNRNTRLIMDIVGGVPELSIFTGSLIHEHYTRECEFGNFDKIKNTKTQKTKQHKKKHKKFWLNFCLNKECPKLLCGLGICHRRRQTIPMWNSSGEKRILQGITVCLMSAVLSTM